MPVRTIDRRLSTLCIHLGSHQEGAPHAVQPRASAAASMPDTRRGASGTFTTRITAGGSTHQVAEPFRFCPPYDHKAMLDHYNAEGFVLVSGLIPAEACEAAVAAMWRELAKPGQVRQDGIDGARQRAPIDQHDTRTWPLGRQQQQFTDPAIEALWNPDYLRMAEFLSDGYIIYEGTPGRDYAKIQPPKQGATVGAINVFPDQSTDWQVPSGHLDHCIPRDGFMTFPRPVRMSTMTYINDCAPGEQHGASTIVWPGSARRFERLAASDPERFKMMVDLGRASEEAGVGRSDGSSRAPIEVKHRAGDVLFYDIFTQHSGSSNTSQTPRFAFNRKWGQGKRINQG
jgi:hypothetical protein